jgi:alpha-tubulin suppressor-like RCC1 family protein
MKNEPKELPCTHFSSDMREVVSAFLILEPHLRPTAETVLSWPKVQEQFTTLNVNSKHLMDTAEKEAQDTAAKWHSEHEQNLQLGEMKDSTNGAADFSAYAADFATTTTTTTRTKGSLRTNRSLVSKSRVWRFGSGQSTPKLIETMLEHDISMVALGGIDTLTSENDGSSGGGSGENHDDDDDDDDDEFNEWDDCASGTLTSFALCVSRAGDVFTFGATSWESSFTSRLPRSMSEDGVSSVSCGTDYCLAIDCLGRVWIWGEPEWLDLVQEPSGKRNSFASSQKVLEPTSLDNGNVLDKEEDNRSKLIRSGSSESGSIPLLLGEFGLETRALQVACGDEHLAVLDVRGNVWTCGDGTCGALGHGTTDEDIDVPQKIMHFDNIMQISCGATYCLALQKGGATFFWGTMAANIDVLLVPTQVSTLQSENVVQVNAGRQHCAVVTDGGLLYTWGTNTRGECGQGHIGSVEEPTLVSDFAEEGDEIRFVSCGARHTAAVTSDDCLFVWGDNTYGALGTNRNSAGTTKMVNVPTQIRKFGRKGCKVDTVEAGVHETFVITKVPSKKI